MDVLGQLCVSVSSEEKPFSFYPDSGFRSGWIPLSFELLNLNPDPDPGGAENLHLNFKTG
jgi:hypothetical protein